MRERTTRDPDTAPGPRMIDGARRRGATRSTGRPPAGAALTGGRGRCTRHHRPAYHTRHPRAAASEDPTAPGLPRLGAAHEQTSGGVDEERDNEEHDREPGERRQLHSARLTGLQGDDARQRRTGSDERREDTGRVSEQHDDGDGFPHRTAESEG